ncbi:glycosyltransferase family 4 protein [Mesorhizobium sp.]|uniref:glycosyltransferase family 4 protein n=1 Tax=Mesorhizobium sp. TaxID=1871066 RepID=UPI0025BCBB5A|nr:glycosyltransferase family 4 protein [Mesorhizobium sp.]
MKVAFVLNPSCLFNNVFSGVVVQANCWALGLRALGHEVVFPAAQEPIDWNAFDIVHLFQHGPWCLGLLHGLKVARPRVFYSPIIDPPKPYGRLAGLISRLPLEKLRLAQNQRLLRLYGGLCDRMLARSGHEADSLCAIGVPAGRIATVHIPMSKPWDIDDAAVATHPRNGAVLHVSHLNQPRKNARALIELSVSKGFPLRLAGSVSDPGFRSWLDQVQKDHPNVTYLGRISDGEMLDEMLSCAVFCLPSLYEGVGLVALDAGYCGANLVVTDRGGTPEYLRACSIQIDPSEPSALGSAIARALQLPVPNLAARRHVIDNFSIPASARSLAAAYDAA